MEWTPIVDAAYDCSISVGTIAATGDITVQLKDFAGNNLTEIGCVDMYISTDVTGLTSTTIASASADTGIVLGIVDTYSYKLISNASGLSVAELDGSGGSTAYMNVILPNGRVKHSGAIVFTG